MCIALQSRPTHQVAEQKRLDTHMCEIYGARAQTSANMNINYIYGTLT